MHARPVEALLREDVKSLEMIEVSLAEFIVLLWVLEQWRDDSLLQLDAHALFYLC